jgi:predicted Zn-dependent protease
MRSIFRALLPVLAIAPAVSACAVSTSPVTGRQRAYAYSWEQEVALGREVDRQIVAQFGTYDDPQLEAYVRRVGESVLQTSHLRREGALPEYQATKFTFRVLDTETVNAFALPGGFVYVTRGLLAHLDNEAQLAVVLGHEVAHVAARHSSQNALETGLVMVGLLGASLLGEEMAGIGEEIGDFGSIAAQLFLFRYSRDDERESDRLGVEYAAMAGYRAAEGADFFTALQRMQARAGWLPGFLSTHPDPGRREETVAQLAAEWAGRGYDGQRVEREAFLAQVEGITLGEDPRQGFEMDGMFYHPEGGFRFPVPRGWEVVRDGRNVQLKPRGLSGIEVEFGARSQHERAYEAADAFVRDNRLTGASSAATTMNGFPGARVEASLGSGDRLFRVSAFWMEHDGQVRRFVGISESGRGEELDYAVAQMTRGFRTLTDPGILGMQPVRLRLVTTREALPFRSHVDPRLMPRGMDLEALAILNGGEVDAVIPAGTVLKLPG